MPSKILVIDDEVNLALLLCKVLTRHAYDVTTAHSGESAKDLLNKQPFDLVLCDFRLGDINGYDLLKHIKTHYPAIKVIVITGYPDVKQAVELIKSGADNYLSKPFSTDELLASIDQAIVNAVNDQSVATFKKPENNPSNVFVQGTSAAAIRLLQQIELIAPTNYSVILEGESGTGKECAARYIHEQSLRADKPFLAVDCGAILPELAASEFFGHVKGAYTGADTARTGYFEMANGGTLFLDEITNLPYDVQAALLRTVQERRVRRIGSAEEIAVDVRIIVATNRNLRHIVDKGDFREDLYHRFNEFNINLAPLRERKDDILSLANYFLAITSQELQRGIRNFSAGVIDCLLAYSWPGNVRQLKNAIRRAALLTDGDSVELQSLPREIVTACLIPEISEEITEKNIKAHKVMHQFAKHQPTAEFREILSVLRQADFNKTQTAAMLNINRKTLYNKLKRACS
ncbi:sigma-54-dependent Fis family transcriptional regulator [Mucilaginibacter sp. Bleaf8]|uniref:sigma-54-dependent transcriptional regulator n=1 Tax=Mucilaginibacter sp. Bleaf8 TaxID=2834430 RepID=UPI001BD0FE9A|nr:sigma-54 dependent transcriptional regulator [Mucilaginibacter sp. Bleaf8]MBS7563896.1 sigma-54-dependent Fis family transcriptional regulator [Mucilaginibacter sp. Bleaf8]